MSTTNIEFVREVVSSSKTYSEALRKLRLDFHNKNQFVMFQDLCIEHNIDCSHLTKKFRFTTEELIDVVRSSSGPTEVAKKLGHSKGYIATIFFAIRMWNIDISHFNKYTRGDLLNSNAQSRKNMASPPLDLIFRNSISIKSQNLKNRLWKEGLKERCCEICRRAEYLGEPISLELNHKNGDSHDNGYSNLEIICSNCHSQTINFAGRNARRRISDKQLVDSVVVSDSMAALLRELGYLGSPADQTVKAIKDRIGQLGIGTSHWRDTSMFSTNVGRRFGSYIPVSSLLKKGSKI